MSALEKVNLGLDELEAVRMADLEGLYHEEAAVKMGISRQTFGNIIESARKKIADALVNSKAIVMEGGRVTMVGREFFCSACNHVWTVPCDEERPEVCPKCSSANIHRKDISTESVQNSGNQECRRKMKRCEQ